MNLQILLAGFITILAYSGCQRTASYVEESIKAWRIKRRNSPPLHLTGFEFLEAFQTNTSVILQVSSCCSGAKN